MIEGQIKASVTEALLDSAPEACVGCEALFANCADLARKVIDGALTAEEAQEALSADLSDHCRGIVFRPTGWGQQSRECTYDVPLCPAGLIPGA